MTEDWRAVGSGVSAWFEASSLTAGAALVEQVAELTDDGELPDLELRANGVRVRIGTGDLTFARAVSVAAQELGLVADPAALQTVRLAIDAADRTAVKSFWQTALGYEPVGDHKLGDPLRRDPSISFHRQDPARSLRNRMHVDIVRVPEAVEVAIAAVGQEPYGAYELTLADPDGNEIDLVPGGELSKETADWQTLFGAMTFYPTTSPMQASDLATTVAGLADDAGLPLLVDLRAEGVAIDTGKDLWENDEGAAEPRFVDLAGRIETAAYDLGLTADPARLRFVQFAIDAVEIESVRAFWTTVLGYEHDPRPHLSDIYDPRRLNPVLMFQPLDAADEERRRQRDRIHLELLVPADQVQARIDTALAAGGSIVAGQTLADPEGNELTLVQI